MKITYLILWLILTQVILGCNFFKSNDAQMVVVNLHGRDGIRDTDSVFLSKLTRNDTLQYVYADTIFSEETLQSGKKIYSYSFFKLTQDSSKIYTGFAGFDVPVSLVAQKTFTANGKSFTISKYYQDFEYAEHYPPSFFYHQQYGLLAIYSNYSRSLIYTMTYDKTSKILIDSILQDTTGFYKKRPKQH